MLRFGCGSDFSAMMSEIYSDRRFIVQDGGCSSNWHVQSYGISQGCPLSPFLFSILMTVALHDANMGLAAQGVKLSQGMLVHDLVYFLYNKPPSVTFTADS